MALELCRRNLASIEKAKAIITIQRREIFHFRSIEHSFTNNQLNKQKAFQFEKYQNKVYFCQSA